MFIIQHNVPLCHTFCEMDNPLAYCSSFSLNVERVETIQITHNISCSYRKKASLTQKIVSHLSSLSLQELQAQLSQRTDQYHHLLDQGESMLLTRGGEESGPGTTQTQQNLSILQNKWASLNAKMDDRRVKT